MASATVFSCVFIALWVAHQVGDHWVQTHTQACGKGAPGRRGQIWCARHVATLTATKAAVVAGVAVVLSLPLAPLSLVVALGVDAVSHYWADRRTTLARLADRVGKGEFARLGDGTAAPAGTGAYALDQSWHVAWLLIAALIACLGTG
ncbi:DUF3307 domain-containing protein [Spirillospora sp. NBC_00431]